MQFERVHILEPMPRSRAKYKYMQVRQFGRVQRARALHLFDQQLNLRLHQNCWRVSEKLRRFHQFRQRRGRELGKKLPRVSVKLAQLLAQIEDQKELDNSEKFLVALQLNQSGKKSIAKPRRCHPLVRCYATHSNLPEIRLY